MLLLDFDLMLCHLFHMRLVVVQFMLYLFEGLLQPLDFQKVTLDILQGVHMNLIETVIIGCELVIFL
jgi:hypothetical protein